MLTVEPAVQQALNKAKISLMSRPDSVFFTTVCFSLHHIWDDKVRTAATDGTVIRFNPTFFMSLDAEERIFLLIHETMHVAYLHMQRNKGRDHQKFNKAADHVINLMLIDRKFKMPKMGLADPQYKGMSTEQVYDLLPDDPTSDYDSDLQLSDKAPEDLQREVEDILVRAQIHSKMGGDVYGTIPGEIELFLNKLLSPKLPWHTILRKYLQAMAKNDYTFKKPNRRFFPKYHLPSLYSETLMDIAIAVDISGSVSDLEFKTFISEIKGIFTMMKPNKISLIQFDTKICSVTEITSLKELSQVDFKGRGGTDINPVLEWSNEHKPQLLLVFSDGEFRFSNLKAKATTIWLIHNTPTFAAPFGKVIHYTIAA